MCIVVEDAMSFSSDNRASFVLRRENDVIVCFLPFVRDRA